MAKQFQADLPKEMKDQLAVKEAKKEKEYNEYRPAQPRNQILTRRSYQDSLQTRTGNAKVLFFKDFEEGQYVRVFENKIDGGTCYINTISWCGRIVSFVANKRDARVKPEMAKDKIDWLIHTDDFTFENGLYIIGGRDKMIAIMEDKPKRGG